MKASQVYEEVVESQAATDLVGRPIALRQGQGNATGETIFLSDVQPRNGNLRLHLDKSRRACTGKLRLEIIKSSIYLCRRKKGKNATVTTYLMLINCGVGVLAIYDKKS